MDKSLRAIEIPNTVVNVVNRKEQKALMDLYNATDWTPYHRGSVYANPFKKSNRFYEAKNLFLSRDKYSIIDKDILTFAEYMDKVREASEKQGEHYCTCTLDSDTCEICGKNMFEPKLPQEVYVKILEWIISYKADKFNWREDLVKFLQSLR